MRLGIGSWTYPWSIGVPGYELPEAPMNALDLLRRAKSLGVSVVQICDNIPLEKLSTPELTELGRAARQMDITIQTGTRGVTPAHLLKHLEIASILNSNLIRTITDTPGCEPEKSQVVKWLKEILPEFKKADIRIAIENHDRFSCTELADIIEGVGSPSVGICLDTVNSFGALERTREVIDILAPHTINLHVKDFGIERVGNKMGFLISGRPAGSGMLDLDRLFERLAAAGRTPDVILEQWPPFEGTVAKSIVNETQWAETGILFLHRKLAELTAADIRPKAART